MRKLTLAALVFILLLIPSPSQAKYNTIPTSSVGLSGTRQVPLTIRLVFLGLSNTDINSTYLTSKINIPAEKSQSILAGPQTNGVSFQFTYQLVFADPTVTSSFANYTESLGKTETYTIGALGSINRYFDNTTTRVNRIVNYYYDADKVEGWLDSSQSFGTAPVPGYTLFIADLHNNLPSITYPQYKNYTTKCSVFTSGPNTGKCDNTNNGSVTVHYYNRTMTEPDLLLNETRHFMTGWGGKSRFDYIDLSAGPSYWTGELPIQVAPSVREVDPSTPYIVTWRTQFIADYIFGAVYDLFAPDQIYPVNYSARYNFHLFVFDARNASEIAAGPTIQSSVNETRIKSELSGLVPFATVTLTTKYATLSSSPGLAAVVSSATTKIVDKTANNGTVVDARPVYNWLSTNAEDHITQFINATRTAQELDIPAFIFAFTGKYNFGFTFKSDVFLPRDDDSIFGVALGDLVLISHGQRDLKMGNYITDAPLQPGKGIGFTRTIIHELGHMLGLAHPFTYDSTNDFVDSVMGYYANSLTYSSFDRDMILRGVNDELLIFAEVTLASTSSSILNSGRITAARRAIQSADQKYSGMNYAGAVSDSLTAAENALAAQGSLGGFSLFSPTLLFLAIGLIVGTALGLLVGFLAFKKRTTGGVQYFRCPTCGTPLRWEPAMMRWYCDRCQKPV